MGEDLICLVTGASAGVLLSHHLKVLKCQKSEEETAAFPREIKNKNSQNENPGIGLHTAKKLVDSGATVLLHARWKEENDFKLQIGRQ